jgi:hypothetical protein
MPVGNVPYAFTLARQGVITDIIDLTRMYLEALIRVLWNASKVRYVELQASSSRRLSIIAIV